MYFLLLGKVLYTQHGGKSNNHASRCAGRTATLREVVCRQQGEVLCPLKHNGGDTTDNTESYVAYTQRTGVVADVATINVVSQVADFSRHWEKSRHQAIV